MWKSEALECQSVGISKYYVAVYNHHQASAWKTIVLFKPLQLNFTFLGSADCTFEISKACDHHAHAHAYIHIIHYKIKYTDSSLRCPGVIWQESKIRAAYRPHCTTTGIEEPGLLSWIVVLVKQGQRRQSTNHCEMLLGVAESSTPSLI